MKPMLSALSRSAFLVAMLVFAILPQPLRAADRDKLAAYLNVTGFDVALDSLRLSAGAAPRMLGQEPGEFGSEWTRLADEVFDTELMRDMAMDILSQTLSDPLLTHAVEFYASDLGQRLVEAENASHMKEDDDAKQDEGRALVAAMVEAGSPRAQVLRRMNLAIDSAGMSTRALQEIQLRFLMAASSAGVVELELEPDEMRAFMKGQEGALRRALAESALAGAAYTYQSFSDEDLEAYAEALEHPDMQKVYELMNAVQWEIMANRFEALAARMAGLQAGQDI